MSQVTIKGRIAIDIDIAEIEARLTFTPEPEGTEWGLESLYKAVLERQLSMVSQRAVDTFMQKAAQSKTPLTETIAKGTAPTQAEAESADWIKDPIPPELAAIADEKVHKTPPPSFSRVRIETIKRETFVKKPNPIPFMPPKEEKVISVEKREIREPVGYDTQMLGFAFVKKGQRLASVFPPKAGKGGKSVFNRPIAAPVLEHPELLLNESISRSGRELIAAKDGFLRYGKNWADICPFATHSWELSPSPDRMSILLEYNPGDSRLPVPDCAEILKKAQEMGGLDLIDERSLDQALHEAAANQEPICSFLLTKDQDASIDIDISEDYLKASLRLVKARGHGRPLDLRVLSEKLKVLGIKVKNPEKLKTDIVAFYKGPESELKDYPLAEGNPPGKGKDRSIALQVSFLPPDKTADIKKRLLEKSAALGELTGLEEFPLAECQKIGFINEGKQILSLSKNEAGAPGFDVFGKQIPPVPGLCPTIKAYDNIRFSNDTATPLSDGIVLYKEADNVHYLRALPYRDAEVQVKIAPDILSVAVSLFPQLGLGIELKQELVLAALKAAGVVNGILEEEIKVAIAQAGTGFPIEDRVVARGKNARAPGSRRVEWKVQMATGKGVTLNAAGQADYRNQDRITTVKEGDLVALLQKTTDPGEAGMDVKGKKIEIPKADADQNLSFDASLREEPSESPDTIKLVAARAGELRFEKNALSIVQNFNVKGNVDMKVGNLRFPGDVTVSGSVCSGFMLVSSGSVTIGEGVDAALVSAEGMVRMGLGVKGQGKGTIRARKGIELLFAEHANLFAVEDIKIKNGCVSCNVKTNAKLQLLTDKGHLLGGRVRAKGGVEVQNLGSDSNIATSISFGQDYLVFDLVEAEQKEIDKIKAALLEYEKKMAEAEKHHSAELTKLRQDKLKLLKLLEKRSMRLLSLNDQFELHFPSEVRVRGTVFPGVVLESHNRTLEVRQQKTKVCFYFDQETGHIKERPLTEGK